MNESTALITDDSTFSAKWYVANTEFMAVNLGDHISGVFWAAFLLFSWTAVHENSKNAAQNTPLM